ncbi:hypothetical protein P4U90_15550 [Cytobacillus kochii]|uniref:esterase/lipase family protein n=1 Tax=Cytobacillus kochii TaxID=859143 RepID=UPI002E228029|nr:hypothetical protein [Cytobacillus kochii]
MVACIAIVTLFMLTTSQVFAAKTITPQGKLKPPGEVFTPGEWFLGSVPPNLDTSKPPIVFVQGKNGSSTSWYEETEYHGVNDMYTKAYESGYQTVFLQLHDAAGEGSASQFDNGELLASMLADISAHFQGRKLNIVAHSKGGPDTQAALIHYGAHAYVGRVITLGSPHHGSHLADLAYSWWAGWLGTLLGQKDDGTFSLQVGEMAHFRSITDHHSNATKNKYYTVSGTNKGPSMSALWMGGQYLSSEGENDGLVNDWSTRLPYGTHLFNDTSLDHDKIRMGSAVFSRIEPYLRTSSVAGLKTDDVKSSDTFMSEDISSYTHGGEWQGNAPYKQSFHVDEQLKNIQIWTSTKDVKVRLISPTGKEYQSYASSPKSAEIFNGAAAHSFTGIISETGRWQVRLTSNKKDNAYVMNVTHEGKNNLELKMNPLFSKDPVAFSLQSNNNIQSITMNTKLVDKNGNTVVAPLDVQNTSRNGSIGQFNAKLSSGVYNMTIDIKGKTLQGAPYERTVIRSFYVQ